jgi:hypothetical protein
MHGPINFKSPNNISKWQTGFNSAFKGLFSGKILFGHLFCVVTFYCQQQDTASFHKTTFNKVRSRRPHKPESRKKYIHCWDTLKFYTLRNVRPRPSLKLFPVPRLGRLRPWGRLSLEQKWIPGMSPGGKCGRCVGLTNLPPSCADCLEIWEPQPPGANRACPGL